MSKRASFHTQLASIMEILSRTAMAHVCKLVDDEYAGISLENEALTEKLHNLESEFTIVKSTAPKLAGNYRSVGVQTGETITRIDRGMLRFFDNASMTGRRMHVVLTTMHAEWGFYSLPSFPF